MGTALRRWSLGQFERFHVQTGTSRLPRFSIGLVSGQLGVGSIPAWRTQFSRSVVSGSLRPHGLQHARPPCPSPTPGAYSNSCLFESVMPSNHLILSRPLLLLPSVLPSIRVFSNEPVLRIGWPKDWSFSFSVRELRSHFLCAAATHTHTHSHTHTPGNTPQASLRGRVCPCSDGTSSLPVSLGLVCFADPGGCESRPEVRRGRASVPLPWEPGGRLPPSRCPGRNTGAWRSWGCRGAGGCRCCSGDRQKPRAWPGPPRGDTHRPSAQLAPGRGGRCRVSCSSDSGGTRC